MTLIQTTNILIAKNTTFRGVIFPMHFQCLLGIKLLSQVQRINGISSCIFENIFYIIQTVVHTLLVGILLVFVMSQVGFIYTFSSSL